MLKLRIISAVILAPIVVLSVLYMPQPWFALFLAVIALLGAWEWATMVTKTVFPRITYVLVCAVLIAVCWFIFDQSHIQLLM